MERKTCLYRHFAADGSLLYVGMTNSALRRIDGHRAKSGWVDQIHRVEIEWFATRAEAHAAERAAIVAEQPKHNRIRYHPKPERPQKGPKGADLPGMTRTEKKRRLERAGFRYVEGWLPERDADDMAQRLAAVSAEQQRLLDEPPAPRGPRGPKPKR